MYKRGVGRPTGATLSREDFVVAAMTITSEQGLAAVNATSVASRLGVSRATAYHHIGAIDSLKDDVSDRVIGELRLPADPSWRTWCEGMVAQLRTKLLEYPGVARRIREVGARSPSQLDLIDTATSVLRGAGASVREAALTYAALVTAVCDSVEFAELRAGQQQDGSPAHQTWRTRARDSGTSANLRSVLEVFTTLSNEDLYWSSVGNTLDAAESRLKARQTTRIDTM